MRFAFHRLERQRSRLLMDRNRCGGCLRRRDRRRFFLGNDFCETFLRPWYRRRRCGLHDLRFRFGFNRRRKILRHFLAWQDNVFCDNCRQRGVCFFTAAQCQKGHQSAGRQSHRRTRRPEHRMLAQHGDDASSRRGRCGKRDCRRIRDRNRFARGQPTGRRDNLHHAATLRARLDLAEEPLVADPEPGMARFAAEEEGFHRDVSQRAGRTIAPFPMIPCELPYGLIASATS